MLFSRSFYIWILYFASIDIGKVSLFNFFEIAVRNLIFGDILKMIENKFWTTEVIFLMFQKKRAS